MPPLSTYPTRRRRPPQRPSHRPPYLVRLNLAMRTTRRVPPHSPPLTASAMPLCFNSLSSRSPHPAPIPHPHSHTAHTPLSPHVPMARVTHPDTAVPALPPLLLLLPSVT